MNRTRRCARALALSLLTLTGCGSAMIATRVEPPVRAHEAGLGVHVAEVHVSADVRNEDFSSATRVLVVLDLIADRDSELDLSRARLSFRGAGEHDETHVALASGLGQAPHPLHDGEFIPPLRLARGEHVRAWVAFGTFAPRATRELPESIELELPGGQRLALSQPGAAPVWRSAARSVGYGTGVWLQGAGDDVNYNVTFEDLSFVGGPLVIGVRHGFGVREIPHRARGDDLVCCNIALAGDVSWPMWQSARLMSGPFVGFEAAILPRHTDVEHRSWYGPSLGLEFAMRTPPPLHGPFPISYPRSILPAFKVRAALVQWFGSERSFASFGFMFSFSSVYSE